MEVESVTNDEIDVEFRTILTVHERAQRLTRHQILRLIEDELDSVSDQLEDKSHHFPKHTTFYKYLELLEADESPPYHNTLSDDGFQAMVRVLNRVDPSRHGSKPLVEKLKEMGKLVFGWLGFL